MHRREVLRILAGTAALPLLPGELLALGRALRAAGPAARFQVLDQGQRETVATIADLIIPETDTPGARAAGVAEFVDVVLAGWYDEADRDRFLAGLADVDVRSRSRFGKPFVECAAAQQTDILTALDQEVTEEREAAREGLRREGRDTEPQRHFFHMMKQLTLVGYYTSEVGANRELHYQIIPGRYDGCAPLAAGGD